MVVTAAVAGVLVVVRDAEQLEAEVIVIVTPHSSSQLQLVRPSNLPDMFFDLASCLKPKMDMWVHQLSTIRFGWCSHNLAAVYPMMTGLEMADDQCYQCYRCCSVGLLHSGLALLGYMRLGWNIDCSEKLELNLVASFDKVVQRGGHILE